MDSSRPLLKPIGVPRDVIVEEDVTALEVDAFPSGFGGDKNLNRSFPELLFSVQPRSRLIPRTNVHTTVNRANGEIPLLQFLDQIVERVFELGEDEKQLLRVVEETLLLQQFLETGKFRLASCLLDTDRVLDEPLEFLNFLLNLIWIPGETDGSDHVLQTFAFRILHLVQFFHVRQVGWSIAGDFLSL